MRIADAVVLAVFAGMLGLLPGPVFAQAQLDGFYGVTVEEENGPSGLGVIFAKQAGEAFTAVVSILDQTFAVEEGEGEGEGEEAEKGAWALMIGTIDPSTGEGTATMLASSGLMVMGTVTIHVGENGERGSFATDFGALGTFLRIFP